MDITTNSETVKENMTTKVRKVDLEWTQVGMTLRKWKLLYCGRAILNSMALSIIIIMIPYKITRLCKYKFLEKEFGDKVKTTIKRRRKKETKQILSQRQTL